MIASTAPKTTKDLQPKRAFSEAYVGALRRTGLQPIDKPLVITPLYASILLCIGMNRFVCTMENASLGVRGVLVLWNYSILSRTPLYASVFAFGENIQNTTTIS